MTHYILITTKDRLKHLNNCLESIHRTTPESKVFVVNDGSTDDTDEYLTGNEYIQGYVNNYTNIGIAPSIEIGLHLINNYHRFRFNEGKEQDKDPWISYVQDDVEFLEVNWPNICVGYYMDYMNPHGIHRTFINTNPLKNIGFITGHVAPEHENSREISPLQNILLRNHIRATHMMAPMSFWMEQLPITVNGELNIPRGHPGNGIGSDIDWYFLRGHDKSVLKRGMTNLVIPGILKHNGSDCSTWQKNQLPEVIC